MYSNGAIVERKKPSAAVIIRNPVFWVIVGSYAARDDGDLGRRLLSILEQLVPMETLVKT